MYDPTQPPSRHRRVADAKYLNQIYDHLGALVIGGRLTFPSQVVDELYPSSSPDIAGMWAHAHKGLRQHMDPGYDTLRLVLAEIARQFGLDKPLADPSKTSEDADPWIVAQAVELKETGLLEAVVTEDRRDRGTISVTTACRHLGLPCVATLHFLNHCGAPPEPDVSD
jgi:hypothetical protein